MARIALITGTSSGIGLSSAVQLAQAGFEVIATLRHITKAGPLEERARSAGVSLDVRHLDVQSDLSVQTCVREVLERYGRIDVLVNNAGAGHLGTMEEVSLAELRQTMEVNFYGVWRVTQAVFPAMREAKAGRILTVTSVGGLIGQPFNDAYCAAKFACEGFLESLAPVAQRLGIQLSLIEPGPVNTEFIASVKERRSGQGASHELYGKMLESYMAGTAQAFATLGQTPDDVARVIVEAATADKPHLRYVTSERVRDLVSRKYTDVTGDSIIALTGARLPSMSGQ